MFNEISNMSINIRALRINNIFKNKKKKKKKNKNNIFKIKKKKKKKKN